MNEHRNSSADAPKSPDELLSALVDGELSEVERVAIIARLADDPAAAACVAHYRAQNSALKTLFPLPSDGPMLFVRCPAPWPQRAGAAAAWSAAGLCLGLAMHWTLVRFDAAQPAFARLANVAYVVYAPEQQHPVDVAAAQEAHLVQWLSQRLNRSVSVPSLQKYGYALVGGRLLPSESGPAALFMYQNPAGDRLTLYITESPKKQTSFRLLRDGERRTFYWVNQGMGYALSGRVAEANLRAIALEVRVALGGHPDMG
ncbi:anti-sigma factor family protein [Ralstonia pickettii]|uniref:anti-sigma factor family protein n=1 Tax=Ralstonia pickettii TaxID=329 RepID=UPI00056BC9B2|nr:anti-sigma factor [Ralstonia pickettii]